MSTFRVAAVGLAAGLITAFSLPPWGLWILAPVGLAILYRLLEGRRAPSRALAGFTAGIGLFSISLFFTTAFNAGGWAVLVLFESAFVAVACALVPPARGRSLAFPAVLVFAEVVRGSWPFGGLPMGGIPLGQVGSPLGPAARLGGPMLLLALAALGGVVLGELARLVPLGQGTDPRRRTQALATTALAAVAIVGLAVAGDLAPDGGPAVGGDRIALVQGGGRRGFRASQVDPASVFEAQLTPSLALQPPLTLILWPENVLDLNQPLRGSAEAQQVSQLAVSKGATVVAGVTEPVGTTQFRNIAVAWAPSGAVVATYDKVHRVPFGEWIPWRSFFGVLADLSAVPRDAIPGHGPGILHTPAGPLGVMISYEVFYEDAGRAAVRSGAQLLTVPTNTASYSTSQVPTQELATARMQAVQEGRDLIQTSPTGFSAIVDHRGHVLARSNLGSQQVIEGTPAMRTGLTPYARTGDMPVLAASGLAVVAAWALEATARRRRRPDPGP
ncbi:MAG TPA: apolipoprotein N-acyltransferase [Acidimicrobiales bacterium]